MTWLTSWNYRKAITISNTGSVLTDYQTLITIDTASLVAAGKLLSSCSDIRFTDSDGSTLLNYWIESGCNTSSTNIWIKIPSIVNGTNTIYMYYGNSSATSNSDYFGTFNILGDGSNGSLTVTAANTVINSYTYISGTGTAGSTTIAVNSGASFSNGDEILIIQMKDVSGSSAGTYEFRKVSSGGGTTTFTLSTPLKNNYTSVTQVVKIPQYTSVTVNSGASLTASAWDGNTGGIVALRASGTVDIVGSITVNDKGYLNGETYKGNTMYGGGGGGGGGAYEYRAGNAGGTGGTSGGANGAASANSGGFYGTPGGRGGNGGGPNGGTGGNGGGSPGANCGGGGGGGGGGGNFYGLGGLGGGKGGRGSCASGSAGINGGSSTGTNGSAGNGGGGYGTNGGGGRGSAGSFNGIDGTISGGGNGGNGSGGADYGGAGAGGGAAGLTYGSADLSTIFLGTSGGNVLVNTGAGGIIIIFVNTITVTGTISSNGSNANGAIGGSSGGSIYLTSNYSTIGSSLVSATGGTGVSGYGGGGAGGSGRIRISANSISGTSTPSAYTSGFDTDHNRKYASTEPTLTIGTEQIPTAANITAISMTITPSESPCRQGICTVSVSVTWTNTGETSGSFVPNISVDGTPASPIYLSESLGPGATTTHGFTVSGLSTGIRSICPYPN